ncbi:MinD/ParA family ATP-binding protein [Micromonospora carbonacea]|uniref:MinD/ParA family ATP-binding protein n=1 Tax=Micromonospora carbonacea TaxID=47853 RepID=UPI00340236B2
MALGGRALDGTETSWGRPAEPAPRWRALLDRARLGGRTAEQAEADRHAEEAARAAPEPLPRRGSGNGYAGRAAIGPPGEQPYAAEPGYPAEPARGGYRAGASYRVDPAYRIDPSYQPEPPSYQPEAPGYQPEAPGYQPEQAGYPADPLGYQPEPPGYQPEPTYPAEPSWRSGPGRPDPEPPRRADPPPPAQSRYSLLDGGGYRPEPAPVESRYSLLDSGGYRPEPAYPPPLTEPVYQPPVVEPAYPPPPAEPVYHPPPAEPVYRAEAAYQPVAEPVYQPPPGPPAVVERGYPARIEWRAQSAESELERAAGVLRRDLGTPRVLAFANPKGGVHKTTATVLAAATVGSVRGRGVLAWDDNELRGTLGLRAGSARHARTIRHLIHDLAQIEILEGSTLLGSLDDYLRHAADGSYDVLAGEESPRFAQRLDQFTVKRVLELLRRTHDVVCVDTGNNVESPNWRTVMQAADQLVVTTVPREDAAFSADWMLDLLHEVGMGELADNAVTLISCPTPGRSPLQTDLERHFATRTRAVAVVPYDPALETGSSIEYHQLQPETRQAWLRAASVMLEPFAR